MIISFLLVIFLSGVALYAYKIIAKGGVTVGLSLIALSILGVVLVIFPEKSTVIANYLGVGRGADLLLYFFFVTMMLLVFHIHMKFRKQSIMITELARHVALSGVVKNQSACTDNKGLSG